MAPAIVLDLKFRVIPPERNVFIVFPGSGYFLYEIFVAQQRIFPELPGLELLPGKKLSEQAKDTLDQKIMRARSIERWLSGGKKSDPPSRRLADYHPTRGKWLPQVRGVLAGYFERARKGDLVIVPPQSVFNNALIGELQDEPWEFSEITTPFWDDETVPSRKVKWLATVQRGELSLDLQRRFPSPNAFRELDREARFEIYSLAYGSYSIEDSFTSKFDVTSADFNTIDDYYLQQFFNVVGSLSQGLETKQLGKSKQKQAFAHSLDDIIESLTDDAYVPTLSVNINSPGSLVLSCPKIVPLVAAGLLALTALNSDSVWKAVAANEVKVVNTEAPNDPCTAKVAAHVLEQLNLMGHARWQEMCKKAQKVREDTGLESKSKAEQK